MCYNLIAMRIWRNWQTHWTQNPAVAIPCGFDSHYPQRINIIRTCFPWEKGSDLLFILNGLKIRISKTGLSNVLNPSREAQERRNKRKSTVKGGESYFWTIPRLVLFIRFYFLVLLIYAVSSIPQTPVALPRCRNRQECQAKCISLWLQFCIAECLFYLSVSFFLPNNAPFPMLFKSTVIQIYTIERPRAVFPKGWKF